MNYRAVCNFYSVTPECIVLQRYEWNERCSSIVNETYDAMYAMYDKWKLELFVSMTQKVSQCMNDSMYENEWWKMMNVTNVHACYEKPKHKEMTKVKKCKCVVALRYVWQKKCGKCEKCKHAVALWYMWQKEMCWNTRKVLKKKCIKHVTKRNVLTRQEMCWKTEMTNVRVQVCCGTKYVIKRNVLKKTRNVLENNDKCESASVLWHWDICDERNVKCAEKRQCIKHARVMKWILQVCMKGKHKSVPTKYLKMKMNNMKCKKSEWLQYKNAKCGNIMKVCENITKQLW